MSTHGVGRTRHWIVPMLALLAALVAPAEPAGAQDPPRIVINEIFYHPPCEANYTPCADADAEFIELHNPGHDPVDIGGWSFIDGIDFVFPQGTLVPAVGYLVLAENPTQFRRYFPTADIPHGEFGGGLSNAGERVMLADDQGLPVDQVTYSDGSGTPGAWSVGADGNGDSLSLINATDSDGSSFWWDGADPTPGRANANVGQAPTAIVDNFVWTVLPLENQPIEISADVFGGENVTLQYRINYPGSNQPIPMTHEGGHTWSATIPANVYSAGDLVRFRILNDGTRVAPRLEDSIKWVGTTVADPSVQTDLPLLEWFTSPTNYQAGFNEQGDRLYDGVLAHNGVVYDNLSFRIRGTVARTRDWSKRNWKFKMPEHHDLHIDGISYGLDSLDLQGGFADESRIREYLGHTVAAEMGLVASQVRHVRLHLNGDFFGLHTLQEHPEGGFLDDNDLDNATLFKGVDSPAYDAGPRSVGPTNSVNFENWDIPDYINMLAAASVIQNNDFAHANFYFWYDADEHQRYEGMIWDLDLSQGVRYRPTAGLTVRLEYGSTWSYVWHRWKNQAPMFNQVLRAPFRQLYLRRLRTLADEWFGTGRYEQLARDTFASIGPEWALDTNRWGFWGGARYGSTQAINRLADSWIDQFYAHIRAGGPNGDIPGPQPANPNLGLSAVPSPADPRNQHLRIINNESTAIDISGWRLGGSTTAVLPPGAVLPARGSAYVVLNDRADGFRAVTNNLYVLGEFDAALHAGGGQVDLIDKSGVVRANTSWGDGAPPPGVVLNEWNAVGSSNFSLSGDTRLGSILGNGGDWFELVTVEDNLDLRGWRLEIHENGELDGALHFSQHDVWADVRAGTIITVAETPIVDAQGEVWEEDASYRPEAGDWWIHVVAGAEGSGTYVTASNFKVSNDDWQLAIYDTDSVRRFGPAGEGVGTLVDGGISSTQIGELEEDPTPAISANSAYDDGDESTFGLPNNFADRAQDLDALRPDDLVLAGDVDCSDDIDILDALLIAHHEVGNRVDSGGCPVDPSVDVNIGAGDINGDGRVNIGDALVISQCTVAIDNGFCPDPAG